MPKLNAAQIIRKAPEILQLSYGIEKSNTYVITENGHAIVIDTCSENVIKVISSRTTTIDFIVLTHEHVDHLWGLNALRDKYPEAKVIAQRQCSIAMQDPKANKAVQYRIYAIIRFGPDYQNEAAKNKNYCCEPADIVFDDSYTFEWQGHRISMIHTPGHSPGSILVFVDDDIVFSGDTLLNEETFLKFDGGNAAVFSAVTIAVIKSIRDDNLILPGHGKAF